MISIISANISLETSHKSWAVRASMRWNISCGAPTGVDYQCMGFNIVKTQVEPILCNNGHIYLDRLAILKGQTTAVEKVETENKTAIYDLLGRPTEKKYPYHIYIQDGKKIITNQ